MFFNMINKTEYEAAKEIIRKYELQLKIEQMQLHDNDDDDWQDSEPCDICGEINGMRNPCCTNYDNLHYLNCGYG